MLCYGLSLTSQLSSIRDRSSVTRLSLNKRQQQQKSIFRAALISPTFLPRECHLPLSSFPLLLRRLKENTEQNLVLWPKKTYRQFQFSLDKPGKNLNFCISWGAEDWFPKIFKESKGHVWIEILGLLQPSSLCFVLHHSFSSFELERILAT